METVNATYSYLTNMEVMQVLQKIKSTKKKFGLRNLATVTYEALQYLEESPCKTQTREGIISYVKDLANYRLKSHEVLQMVNDPPTSPLHTQLLIDDNKSPLTDEENEKIIQLTYKHFYGVEPTPQPAQAQPQSAAKESKRAEQKQSQPPAAPQTEGQAEPEKEKPDEANK
ncbi:DNA-directed RNA polymerase III subunit RPC9 [Drosophila guanche]|uniref:DNA-directed RNA polymerase III subunit RPC9 n=1 Tax=Drosophila guanche TaxID=7266 RepID=A0A3B0JDC9_DROGU|nr:DNA-directed RNA polymerase III subunit RPC9 [Drosophila guanche]SPP78122.1 blast:DNA-directed RNA polymerase III subunit RPC9 [Drosophila guanche]